MNKEPSIIKQYLMGTIAFALIYAMLYVWFCVTP